MSAFINFKICDNAPECSGIEVCPSNAFYWDEEENKVKVNNSKCICCRACEEACPAGAIRVAINKEEEQQIKEDYENDPRSIQDLFVERYGASPIDDNTSLTISNAEKIIAESSSLIAIEVINSEDTPCLINSVPIAEAFDTSEINYFKVFDDDEDFPEFSRKYQISELPALLLFGRKQLIFRFVGGVENSDFDQKREFLCGVSNAVNRFNLP